jgi:hypothetical protein
MKVTYIGDPRDGLSGPDPLVWNGLAFPKGKPIDVDDATAARLARNSHFETAASRAQAPGGRKPAADAAARPAAAAA